MSLCMCGAIDCIRCFPENFERGVCMVDLTCDECGCDWGAADMDEYETGLCDECRMNAEAQRPAVAGTLHRPCSASGSEAK